jgi:hypothetical protein
MFVWEIARARPSRGGSSEARWRWPNALKIASEIASALDKAHRLRIVRRASSSPITVVVNWLAALQK